jgi:hypothetical protein
MKTDINFHVNGNKVLSFKGDISSFDIHDVVHVFGIEHIVTKTHGGIFGFDIELENKVEFEQRNIVVR